MGAWRDMKREADRRRLGTGPAGASPHAAQPGAGVGARAAMAVLLLLLPLAAAAYKMESGSIDLPSTSNNQTSFTAVAFQQAYDVVPVVFAVATDDGPHPSTLRIRNVTINGFDVAQVEPPGEDGQHTSMTVHYFAIEPGSHTLPDGTLIEAGTLDTKAIQKGPGIPGPEGSDAIAFSAGFAAPPVLVAHIQTMVNESPSDPPPGGPSDPWFTTAVVGLAAGGADLALERSQANGILPPGTLSEETIGWVAIERDVTGTFTDIFGAPVLFESIATGAIFDGWDQGCDTQAFSAGFGSPPLVMAAKSTHNDDDGGWLRRCSLSSGSVGLTVDEDRDADGERNHAPEAASILAFSRSFAFDSNVTPPTLDPLWQLEADTAVLDPAGFTFVPFRQTYAQPPAVLVLGDDGNPDPTEIRITSVTTTGFTAVPVEPPFDAAGASDSPDQPSTIHYLAADPGLHEFPDGTVVDVGVRSLSAVQSRSGGSYEPLFYASGFSAAPALVLQLQSMANEPGHVPGAASVPWLTTVVESGSIGPLSANVALERAEVDDGSVTTPETLAYFAAEIGAIGDFLDNQGEVVKSEATRTPDNVTGWMPCVSNPFQRGDYAGPPLVIGSQNSRDGNNGGWLRRCAVTAAAVELAIDEDQDNDSERNHTTETTSFLAFDRPFDADFSASLYLFMEETQWTDGAGGTVQDSSNHGLDGTPFGGADTDFATPAIAGDPGTCRYGEFDGSSGYVQVPHDDALNGQDALTYTAWINPDDWSGTRQVMAKSVHGGGSGRAQMGIFSEGGQLTGRAETLAGRIDVNASLPPLDDWSHVALVFTGDSLRLYVDASEVASTSFAATELNQTSDPLNISKRVGTPQYFFDGSIDEVRVYRRVLTQAQIAEVMNRVRPCDITIDHYAIEHVGGAGGVGVTCEAEPVTLVAHDALHNQTAPGTVTVTIGSAPPADGWALKTGGGSFADLGGGSAEYTFAPGETAVELWLTRTSATGPPGIDIDLVDDNAVTESPGEDPPLEFRDTALRFYADGVPASIPLQVAGKPSDVPAPPASPALTLRAVRTNTDTGACEARLTGDQQIGMAYECLDPDTCDGGQTLAVSGTPVPGNPAGSVSSYADVTLTFDASGTAPFDFVYSDAGRIALHAREDLPAAPPDPAITLTGASNAFVVRPFAFDVDFSDDRASNGTGGNSYAADADGSVFVAAGVDFDTTVTAVAWQSGDDADADGLPDAPDVLGDNPATPGFGREAVPPTVTVARTLVAPSPGQSGTLTGGSFTGWSAGAATEALAWDEVGIIDLDASLADYLGSGAAVSGRVRDVGRFVPFDLQAITNTPQFQTACGSFTYTGQEFQYATAPVITVTARNAQTATTENYTGAFFKLTDAKLDSDGNKTYAAATGTLDLGALPAPDPAITDNGNGTATLTFSDGGGIAFDRGAPAAPFDADIALSIAVVDEDDVEHAGNPVSFGAAVPGGGIAFDAGKEMRWGRLVVDNAYGSELLPLELPLRAEYFTAAGYRLNDEDGCTAYDAASLSYVNRQGLSVDPGAAGAGTLLGGRSDPAAPITLTSPLGERGGVDAVHAVPAWLDFDWDGDGAHDDDPAGRVTFGIFGGRDRFIYEREPWN